MLRCNTLFLSSLPRSNGVARDRHRAGRRKAARKEANTRDMDVNFPKRTGHVSPFPDRPVQHR